MIRLTERIEHELHDAFVGDLGAASEIEIGRISPARAEDHLAQHRAAFESDVRSDPSLVKELKQERENDIGLNLADISRA